MLIGHSGLYLPCNPRSFHAIPASMQSSQKQHQTSIQSPGINGLFRGLHDLFWGLHGLFLRFNELFIEFEGEIAWRYSLGD